jgi:hypothetical protein
MLFQQQLNLMLNQQEPTNLSFVIGVVCQDDIFASILMNEFNVNGFPEQNLLSQ